MTTQKVPAKVLLCGDPTVGKTATARVLWLGVQSFPNLYRNTIGVDFFKVNNDETENSQIKSLELWDLAGNQLKSDNGILRTYLKETDLIAFEVDATQQVPANTIKKKIQLILGGLDQKHPKPVLHLVVNKIDEMPPDETFYNTLVNDLNTDSSITTKIHGQIKISYCSAKTNDGIPALKAKLFALAQARKEDLNAKESTEEPISVSSTKSTQSAIFGIIGALAEILWDSLKPRLKKYFFSSNVVRDGFLMALLGLIGMVLVGALSGPFGLLVFSGVAALIGSIMAIVPGTLMALGRFRWDLNPLTYDLRPWMEYHFFPGTVIGAALFLTTLALIITAVFFPAALAGGPLFLAIQFISSGFAGMGLTLSAPVSTFLAVALMGMTAMILWDVACRIGNAILERKGESTSVKTSEDVEGNRFAQGIPFFAEPKAEFGTLQWFKALFTTNKSNDFVATVVPVYEKNN